MIRKILAFILSLGVMGLVIFSVGFSFFERVVVNPDTYQDGLKTINAGELVRVDIQNALIDLMLVNNMPTDWVRDLVSVKVVENLMEQNINNVSAVLTNEDIFSQDSEIAHLIGVFEQRVQVFLQAENKYLDASDIENLELVKGEMKKIIQNETLVLNPEFLSKSGTVTKISVIIQEILKLPILLVLVLMIFMLGVLLQIVFFKKWTQGLRYFGIGIMAGGLFWFMIGLSAKISGFYEQPMIQEGYLKLLVGYLGARYFDYFVGISLIISLIAIVFLAPYLINSYKEEVLVN